MTGGRRAGIALLVAASAGCALIAHAILSRGEPSSSGALVALIPLTLLGITFARRMRHPTLMLLAVLPGVALAWAGWGMLREHSADLFFVEHAGMMALLAFAFGRTLLPGTEPLVSRFARAVHGELDEPSVRYTRGVTIAWTVFFTAIFAGSCALYLTHHVAEWSLLANIITPAAVALMFVAEYAVRRRALPHQQPAGILAGIRAFRRHLAGAQAPR